MTFRTRYAAIFAGTISALVSVADADLILHYTFDDASNPTADSGVSPASSGNLTGIASFSTNTPSGSGQSLSTGDGNNSFLSTGNGDNGGDVNKIDSLGKFTISGWVNLQAAPTTGAGADRLVSKWNGAGFELAIADPVSTRATASNFCLRLQIDGQSTTSTIGADADRKWLFFAVTYDSTTGVAVFYTGTGISGAAQLGDGRMIAGVGASDNLVSPFQVGGTPATTTDRTPNALFDDIRIYDTILDAAAIEQVRQANIPEPSSLALTLLTGSLLVSRKILQARTRH